MFLGEFATKFTGKNRLVLPKNLRDEIKSGEVVLCRGFENCIWGFSVGEFEEMANNQFLISATEEKARELRRYLFSGSSKCQLDFQGRFIVPSSLLEYAKIKEIEVVIIGAGDHFEIWNLKLWNKHLKVLEENFGRLS